MKRLLNCLFALALLACSTAWAQLDPPARVGRLAYLENEVNFYVDRNDAGGPATLNWPVSSGARLSTGAGGRSEVWVGSTAYRLNQYSQLEFNLVDDQRVDLDLRAGTLAISILDRDQVDDLSVNTPAGLIGFHSTGRYRIDVRDDRVELIVQAGQATFRGNAGSLPVGGGQVGVILRDGRQYVEPSRYQDGFDGWVAARENASWGNQSRRYVSPYMTGYSDLDTYGDWQNNGEYGSVWYPRAVASDWAPYRYGRWAWVAPWGWTWIDQAPWGFAPFHYGRWVLIGPRWAWVPGQPVARPVYAPALVGWAGSPGWSVSFSFGSAPAVGWFPLGPREVYVPSYRYSPTYIRQVNIMHVRDERMVDYARREGAERQFLYREQARAVTIVPADHLRNGTPISGRDFMRNDNPQFLRNLPRQDNQSAPGWLAPAAPAMRPSREIGQGDGSGRPAPFFERPDPRQGNRPERVPGMQGDSQRSPLMPQGPEGRNPGQTNNPQFPGDKAPARNETRPPFTSEQPGVNNPDSRPGSPWGNRQRPEAGVPGANEAGPNNLPAFINRPPQARPEGNPDFPRGFMNQQPQAAPSQPRFEGDFRPNPVERPQAPAQSWREMQQDGRQDGGAMPAARPPREASMPEGNPDLPRGFLNRQPQAAPSQPRFEGDFRPNPVERPQAPAQNWREMRQGREEMPAAAREAQRNFRQAPAFEAGNAPRMQEAPRMAPERPQMREPARQESAPARERPQNNEAFRRFNGGGER